MEEKNHSSKNTRSVLVDAVKEEEQTEETAINFQRYFVRKPVNTKAEKY